MSDRQKRVHTIESLHERCKDVGDCWALENDEHYPAWVYKNGVAWVRRFEATSVRPEHWQAYRIAEKRKEGRAPWGHNNARIGAEGIGYPTMEAAMMAAELVI